MYQKILVPLDGSALAESVLPHVRMLAESPAAEIILLQVVVDPIYDLLLTGPKLATATRDLAPTLRISTQSYLDCVANRLRAQGMKVTTIVSEGVVAENILKCANQAQVDLIVMATHGINAPGNWQLGKVTYRIIHSAQVPVLLVRAEQHSWRQMEPMLAATQMN